MAEVVVTAVFHPAPGAKESLVAALREGIPAVHAEDGCILYAIHDAADGTIVMLEKWTSPEDLAAHAAGQRSCSSTSSSVRYLASPVTVTTMTAIPAGTERQGLL